MPTRLRLSLTPNLTLHCDVGGQDGSEFPELAARELAAAFAKGVGEGLLCLAGEWPSAPLATVEGFWRDFGKTNLSLTISTGGRRYRSRALAGTTADEQTHGLGEREAAPSGGLSGAVPCSERLLDLGGVRFNPAAAQID